MEKPTATALRAFDDCFPADARAVRKSMFGMPAGFVNGNMFLGVWADGVVLRLPEDRRVAVAGTPGIGPFEPMAGRPWVEYVLADASLGPTGDLATLALAALDHTAALPAKVPKPRKPKKAPANG